MSNASDSLPLQLAWLPVCADYAPAVSACQKASQTWWKDESGWHPKSLRSICRLMKGPSDATSSADMQRVASMRRSYLHGARRAVPSWAKHAALVSGFNIRYENPPKRFELIFMKLFDEIYQLSCRRDAHFS